MKRSLAALLLALPLAAGAARADVASPTVRLDFGATPPTECRPFELFVDTDADTNGSVCVCRSINTWKCAPVALILHALTHQNGGTDEISVAGLSGLLADPQKAGTLDDALDTPIDTADTPADGEVLKYDAAAVKARWAPGSAAGFTTFDGDYGAETVTSAWDLSAADIELPNGTAPTGTDCDDAAEAGRIFVDTNAPTGQQMYVCEGVTGWVLQGGATISPAYVRLSMSGNQSISNNTLTALSWDTEAEDADGLHSTVTNPDRVTFAEAGLYLVTLNVEWAANSSGVRIAAIELNGTTDIAYEQLPPAGSPAPTVLNVVALYRYSATNYVRAMVYQNSGGSVNVTAGVRTSLTAVRLH